MKRSRKLKQPFILVAFATLLFALSASSLATFDVLLSDQGTGVTDKSSGQTVLEGNLTIEIYTAETGGSLVWSAEYRNGIKNGSWNVILGSNESNTLNLNYLQLYYKDYLVNGEDVNFTNVTGGTVDRLEFISPVGPILSTNYPGNLSVLGDINATTFQINGIDVCLANGSNCLNFNNSGDILWESVLGQIRPKSGSPDHVNISGTLYASNVSSNSPLRLQTAGTTRILVNDSQGAITMSSTAQATGTNAVAIGANTEASGNNAIAIGSQVVVSANLGFGVGDQVVADGDISIAIGDGAISSGTVSFATGYQTNASGDRSTAMGDSTIAIGLASIATGSGTTARGSWSTALGRLTTANATASTATGSGTTASGTSSTAMGDSSTANGTYSTALGRQTIASGTSSIAAGQTSTASGEYSTALGLGNTASGNFSTALGTGTTANGTVATALGSGTSANSGWSTALGRLTTASGTASTAIGFSTTASGDRSTAMGDTTTANGTYSTAAGRLSVASGDYSLAIGLSNTASGNFSTALGTGTSANGSVATALGSGTTASATHSTAIGRLTIASGDQSTAIGFSTTASGTASTAMGRSTEAEGDYSVALGRYINITPSADNSFGFGGSGSANDVVAASDVFVIGTGVNVGIGVMGPTSALHVDGDGNFSGTLWASNVSSNSPLRLQTAGTTRIYVDDSTGDVGIGTSSPITDLDVSGSLKVSDDINLTDRIYSSTDGATYIDFTGETIEMFSSDLSFFYVDGAGTDRVVVNDGSNDIDFQVESDDNVAMLYVDASDNEVGIGTGSPQDPLHVISDSSADAIHIEENSGGEDWQLGVDSEGDLNFQDSGSTRVTFEDGGDVGIGTVSPTSRLHVSGNSNVTGTTYTGDFERDCPSGWSDLNSTGGVTNFCHSPSIGTERYWIAQQQCAEKYGAHVCNWGEYFSFDPACSTTGCWMQESCGTQQQLYYIGSSETSPLCLSTSTNDLEFYCCMSKTGG